jgi:hypothetical protein
MDKLSPSLTVKRLLPEYVASNYPQFVLFLEKYYEWMESEGQAYNVTRQLETLFDVDEPKSEDLLDLILEPVLKDFPTNVAVNRSFLYKRVGEFFRSKGSLESIETLFRILYGEEIRVFLPKEDIIKASSGNWVKRIAIEVGNVRYGNGDVANALNVVGKEIVQLDAGTGGIVARGVVEDVDLRGPRVTFFLAADKQLREFDASQPIISIDSQDPEVEAKVECSIDRGRVTELKIREGGRDYTRVPDVVFYGGRYNNGKNARATAIVTNGVVTGFNLLNPGEGFLRAPQVRVVNQIFADVLENLGEVTVTAGGEYYKEGAEINLSSSNDNGSGQRFRISAVNAGSIQRIDVLNAGGDYSPDDEIIFDNVTPNNYNLYIAPENYEYSVWDKINVTVEESLDRFTYTTADENGAPLTILSPRPARRLVPQGFGVHEVYQVMPLRTDDLYTTSFYVKPEYSLEAINIVNGGTGYTSAPEVIIEGGNPEIPAVATATVSGGAITAITITEFGRGYISAPTVRFSGGGGTGSLATSTINTEIDSIELQIGAEMPAKALPVISGGKVFSINLINGGSNYSTAPTLEFLGGDGTGATATANITSGTVTSFNFTSATDGGSGYETIPPSIYFGKINYGRATFNLKTASVITTDAYGAATSFSAIITPERDGVFRVSLSGKIPGLTLNQKIHGSLILRTLSGTTGGVDGRAWELQNIERDNGLLLFGALMDADTTVRPYINIPSVSTAVATIGELDIEDIILENGDTIALGDDQFVFEENYGKILGARVTNPGSKYQYRPNVVIDSSATSGTGAVVEAIMGRAGGLNSIIVSQVGTGYVGAGISTDTYRRWQAGTVVFRNQILRHVNNLYIITGAASGTTGSVPPTHIDSTPVNFDGSASYTFFGKAATVTVSAPDQDGDLFVNSVTVIQGGSGYTRPPIVTFGSPTGGGQRPKAYAVLSGTSVASIVITEKGSGYNDPTDIFIAPPDTVGIQAQATVTMQPVNLELVQATAEPVINNEGELVSITVTNPGAGYVNIPTITVTPPLITTGSLPTTVADIVGSEVIGIRIENGGDGYSTPPVVVIDPPASPVLFLTLSSVGSGFTQAPVVTITGGGGTGAAAVANFSSTTGSLTSLQLITGGLGYTSNPTVTITGGGPLAEGAVITATINSGILAGGTTATAEVGYTATIQSVSTANDTITLLAGDAVKFRNDDQVTFHSTGTLPAPLVAGQIYFVNFRSGNTMKIAETQNGAAIDLTTAGSGTRTIRYQEIADEELQAPTDTRSITYEDDEYIIPEVTEDRYQLTVPEQEYTYVDPSTTFTASSVTFGPRVPITPPATVSSSPTSFSFKTNPDPVILGEPFERVLNIFADNSFIGTIATNTALTYTDSSALPIPGLESGRRYFVKDVDGSTNSFTLTNEFDGSAIILPQSRFLNVVSFNAVLNSIALAAAELQALTVGDLIVLFAEPGATAPGGLVDRRTYVVRSIVLSPGFITIAEVATPTTIIDFTSIGSGSWKIIKSSAMSAHTFSLTGNVLNMSAGDIASFVDNDIVVYETTGRASGNLISGEKYFIQNIDSSTGDFTLTGAFNGNGIDILDAGTGSHTLVKVLSANDRIVFSLDDFNRLTEGTEFEYIPTGGVQAVATSTIDGLTGGVTGVTMDNQGANYTTVPLVQIVDSDTSRPIGGITLLGSGFGYSSAPTVIIDGGGGAGATATATIGGTGVVTSVTIDTPGDGYSVPPNIQFSGGGASTQATAVVFLKPPGVGATATAVLGTGGNAGRITGITVTAAGSGYHSAQVVIGAPDTRIVPLVENKPYFMVNPDPATRSYQVAETLGGIPLRFITGGSGTHTFRTTPRYLQYDPSLLDEYIDEAQDILYTSINKSGTLSPLYDDTLLLESLDRVLLESSNLNRNLRDNVALESGSPLTIPADDNFINTGDGVWVFTSSTVAFGLTANTFFYVSRIADSYGNGFKFHTTVADALAGTNPVNLTKTGLTFLNDDDYIRIVQFSRVLQETGAIVSLNLLNRGKFYKTLPRVHVNVTQGRFGSGVLLNPIGDAVGTVKRVEVIDPGYNYPNDLPLVFPLNIHVQSPSRNYVLGETVSVGATAKGTVVSWDSHTFLMTLNMIAGQTIVVGNTVVGGTSGASSVVVESTGAAATAIAKALTTYDGYYNGRKHLIDELNIRVQDSRVYQDFSYVIRSSKPFSEYQNMLKKLAHPAGMFVSGNVNYSVIPVNPGLNTVSAAETIITSEAYT